MGWFSALNEVVCEWRRRGGTSILDGVRDSKGAPMRGTIVCGVTDTDDGRNALELAAELSERLDLRLVLAHVADGFGPTTEEGDESVTAQKGREGASRLLARLAIEYRLGDGVERREAVGDRAELLARIAAEEAADLIVIGSQPQRRFRRGLRSTLVRALESESPVPVVIVPPQARQRPRNGRALAKAGSHR
jgi:nucleotide-binding universal stress UspA family protein